MPGRKLKRGEKFGVAVDVHGAGGPRNERQGEELMRNLEPEPVIVPSFENGYQADDGRFAQQLIGHLHWVAERHPVHKMVFLQGHSGGAQFVHRFAFAHPERVSGVRSCDPRHRRSLRMSPPTTADPDPKWILNNLSVTLTLVREKSQGLKRFATECLLVATDPFQDRRVFLSNRRKIPLQITQGFVQQHHLLTC